MVHRLIACLLAMIYLSGTLSAQVYRLTNNNNVDKLPKLLLDQEGDIWCFWLTGPNVALETRKVMFSKLENSVWLPSDSVAGSSTLKLTKTLYDYGYDVDIDTTGGIWLARLSDEGITLFKKQLNDSFVEYASLPLSVVDGHPLNYTTPYSGYYPVFPSDPVSRQYNTITIAAIDSQLIWLSHSRDIYISFQFRFFTGSSFEVFPTTFFTLTDAQLVPITAFKTSNENTYVLLGGWADAHGFPPYPIATLHSITQTDTVSRTVAGAGPETATAGYAQDSLLYFFHWRTAQPANPFGSQQPYNPALTIIDAASKNTLVRYSSLNFFPRTASKSGSFLATGWIENNQIMLKGMNGFQFLKTTTIPENELMADSARRDLYIIADTYPNVWIAWRGILNGQYEVFAMKTQISTEADTSTVVSVPQGPEPTVPAQFSLEQNYPNPFNPTTTIRYAIPNDNWVTLHLYDMLGRVVRTLVDEHRTPGEYAVQMNASDLPSGMYYYRLSSGAFTSTKKLVILK